MTTWQSKDFEKCLTKVIYTNKIQQFDFKKSGKYPIISQNAEFISGYWDNESDVFKLNKPVVIFGDHTRCLKYVDFDFVLGADGVKILQTNEDILPKYLYYYLQYIPIDNLGYSRHYKLLKEKVVRYPSLDQQKKIVRILDKADEIRTKKRLANAKLDEFLKSTFISMFGTPYKNEKIFKECCFGDICTVRQGLQIPISERKSEPKENRKLYITIQYLNGKKNAEYIENPKDNVVCKEEDVLMTRTGNTGMVISGVNGVFHNNFFLIDFNRNILDKQFVLYYLKNPKVYLEILKKAGSSTIPDLNHSDFYKIKLFLPPIEEQNKFAQIVEKVEKQKQKNEQVIEQMNNLFNSLSQKAVKGEL